MPAEARQLPCCLSTTCLRVTFEGGDPWPTTIRTACRGSGRNGPPAASETTCSTGLGHWASAPLPRRGRMSPREGPAGTRTRAGLICAAPPARRIPTGRPMTWAQPIRTARSGMTRSAVTAPRANFPRSIPTAFTAHSPPTAEAAKTHPPARRKLAYRRQRARRLRGTPTSGQNRGLRRAPRRRRGRRLREAWKSGQSRRVRPASRDRQDRRIRAAQMSSRRPGSRERLRNRQDRPGHQKRPDLPTWASRQRRQGPRKARLRPRR